MQELRYELSARRARRKRPQPTLTEALLLKTAQRYIDRYGGPSSAVRDVLQRRVRKARDQTGFDALVANAWIDNILGALEQAGALDDRKWAEERARGLFARGFGVRRISQKLAEKRIPRAVADEVLSLLRAQHDDPDEIAADAYARRRRIGKYRLVDREEHRQRDLGKLARAGFSYAIARKIVCDDEGR